MKILALQSKTRSFKSKTASQPTNNGARQKKQKKSHPSGVVENLGAGAAAGFLASSILSLFPDRSTLSPLRRAGKAISKGTAAGALVGLATGVSTYFVTNENTKGFKRYKQTAIGTAAGAGLGVGLNEYMKSENVKTAKRNKVIAGVVVGATTLGYLFSKPLTPPSAKP